MIIRTEQDDGSYTTSAYHGDCPACGVALDDDNSTRVKGGSRRHVSCVPRPKLPPLPAKRVSLPPLPVRR